MSKHSRQEQQKGNGDGNGVGPRKVKVRYWGTQKRPTLSMQASERDLAFSILHRETQLLRSVAASFFPQSHMKSLGINSSLIGLGLLGLISPAFSALMHNSTTVLVTLNSLRPLREEHRFPQAS